MSQPQKEHCSETDTETPAHTRACAHPRTHARAHTHTYTHTRYCHSHVLHGSYDADWSVQVLALCLIKNIFGTAILRPFATSVDEYTQTNDPIAAVSA